MKSSNEPQRKTCGLCGGPSHPFPSPANEPQILGCLQAITARQDGAENRRDELEEKIAELQKLFASQLEDLKAELQTTIQALEAGAIDSVKTQLAELQEKTAEARREASRALEQVRQGYGIAPLRDLSLRVDELERKSRRGF